MIKKVINPDDWISLQQAVKIHGKSRQAMEKLVKKGRFRTQNIGGYTLIYRKDVENFKPLHAGRPGKKT